MFNNKEEIKLGCKVKDNVSGFEGIAVARTVWLNGCARITIQPPIDKDGKVPENYTVDEPQLEVLFDPYHEPKRTTGGPRPEPVQKAGPTR